MGERRMRLITKTGQDRKVITELNIKPQFVKNGYYFAFILTSKKGPTLSVIGVDPEFAKLEVDLYKAVKNVEPELDAEGKPVSEPYVVCQYYKTIGR